MSPGDVALVKFPFSHLEATKKRPALVLRETTLSPKVRLATVAMITSQVDGLRMEGDTVLEDWERAHLLHPSLVRLAKVATIDADLLEKKLGTLGKSDLGKVRKEFRKLYQFWL